MVPQPGWSEAQSGNRSTRQLRRKTLLERAFGVDAKNPSPVQRALAHRAWRGGGIDVAVRQVAGGEPARRVAHRQQFGMRGRIVVAYDETAPLADDHAVAHHHRAKGLVTPA